MSKESLEKCLKILDNASAKLQVVEKVLAIPLGILTGTCAWLNFNMGRYGWGIIMATCTLWWIMIVVKHLGKH